jgi:hypothetical protein
MKIADEVTGSGAANAPAADLNGPDAHENPEEVLARYGAERDRKLREDNVGQYIDPAHSEKHRCFLEDPWVCLGCEH